MGDDLQMNEFLPGNLRVLPAAPLPVAAAPQQAQSVVAAPQPVVNRVSQAPYAKNQTPVQTGTILPPSGAEPGKSLWEQIGTNKEADLALALALGGFSMAEAAGKPGATPLSAFGTGAKTGISAAANARAAAKKEAMDKELLGIKRQTAQAALAKALKGNLGETEKLIRLRDRYEEGSDDWNRINDIISKKGQFSDKEAYDAVEKAQRGIERIKSEEGWQKDPAKVKQVKQLNARIQKLSTMAEDPATAVAKALTKGSSEFRKTRSKAASDRIDRAYSSFKNLPGIDNLEKQLGVVEYTGKGVDLFNNLRSYATSMGKELGFDLPESWNPSANVEVFKAQSNKFVTQLLKSEMGARPSDRDLEFLISTLPGLGLTKESNARLIKNLRENHLFDLSRGIRTMESRLKDGDLASDDADELVLMRKSYQENLAQLLRKMKEGTYSPSSRMRKILKAFHELGRKIP